jgi:hypothetical protein
LVVVASAMSGTAVAVLLCCQQKSLQSIAGLVVHLIDAFCIFCMFPQFFITSCGDKTLKRLEKAADYRNWDVSVIFSLEKITFFFF